MLSDGAAGSRLVAWQTTERRATYVLLSLGCVLTTFAGVAPSALYPRYLESWALPLATLTVVFAAFMGGVLIGLTLVVPHAERVGHKAMLTGAVLCVVLGTTCFL